jgi:tRNA(Ile)-lysidine synthase
MQPLGPFGPAPRPAVGVSGGPHSLALALLAADWARQRGGSLLALVADHGLRPESGAEAEGVAALLAGQGIAARVLRLGLAVGGAGLQARARSARLAALLAAAAEAGAPWLLLGHHRGDQAETLLHRAAAGSGPLGLAAMAPVRAAAEALILRPLLGVPPARLEAVLAEAGLPPVRDPSNRDPRFTRVRLRDSLADPGGTGPEVAALAAAAAGFGRRRARLEAAAAERLAAGAVLYPEGWASIHLAALGADEAGDAALAALVRVVGGAGGYAPSPAALAALRRAGEGTLGGAWLRRAGARHLLLREPAGAAASPGVPAIRGAVWDRRFRMTGPGAPGAGHEVGALGAAEAARLRRDPAWGRAARRLPAAVLAALPAIRRTGPATEGQPGEYSPLAVVPALLYPDPGTAARFAMVLVPVTGPVAISGP